MDWHDEVRDGKQWLLSTPESTAEERRETQEYHRKQNEIVGRYRKLSMEAGISTSILACIDEVRKHYEETGNVYIVETLKGAGNQLHLSKDSPVCVVLRRDHFPRRVKGKMTVITQYIIINFESKEMSFPWKPIDEGAARGVVLGTEVGKEEPEEQVAEPKEVVGEAEKYTISTQEDDVFAANAGTDINGVFHHPSQRQMGDDVAVEGRGLMSNVMEESQPRVNRPVRGYFTVSPFFPRRRSVSPDSCSSSSTDVSSIETDIVDYEASPPMPQPSVPSRTTSGWTAINHPPEVPVEDTILVIPAPVDGDEETIPETDDNDGQRFEESTNPDDSS